jgi:POT family proton-dependent oligopeptide transporter
MTDPSPAAAPAAAPAVRHPRGLYTLFFTEMWERFSYYGMRALLVLFMVDQIQRGGLGYTDEVANAIYGLYVAAVYLAALPGGWLADHLLGTRRAVWYGGLVIAAGHFTLAIPRIEAFFLGLILVALGTGLLKPNVSALVGQLYPEAGARRDAGFTVFYMGINLGAFLGPIACSTLGEKVNWHYGFAAAGVGMVAGLIQFRLTARHLGELGHPPLANPQRRRDIALTLAALGVLVVVVLLGLGGVLSLEPVVLAQHTAGFLVALGAVYFVALFLFAGLDATEKKRLVVVAILFVTSAIFWAGLEQAGSSLNLFASRFTDREWSGWEMPAGWLQIFNPLFVILLAPAVASLWLGLARRQRRMALPLQFGLGLALLGCGFLVIYVASLRAAAGTMVWPTWLITTYFFHSVGELFLSPVGLSSVTKLAPARLVGQMMGLWFLATSLGNLMAGLLAGQVSAAGAAEMPGRFLMVALVTIGTGLLLVVFVRPIRRLMAGAE